MRRLVLVLAVGCSHPSHHQDPDAAPVPGDVASQLCEAAPGTASVLAVGAASVTFGRMFAGGTWNTGPVTGVSSAPFSLSLLVTNGELAEADSVCCLNHDASCCTADALGIESDPLPSGGELGTHPVRIQRSLDSAFALTGTIDITTFVQPFEHAPGRIAGSVTAVDGSVSVSGSLDNTFCSMLLSATI